MDYKTSLPQSVCPSACTLTLAFLDNFYQNWHRCKNPKSKNELVGGKHRTTLSPILLAPTLHFRRRGPQNTVTNPIAALNVRESPKFPRCTGNLCRGTRWWRQILDRKWKYSRFAHAQWIGRCGLDMGQIPRSTERICSYYYYYYMW